MPDRRPTPLQAASKVLNRLKARGPKEVVDLGWSRARAWVSSQETLVVFVREARPAAAEIDGLTFREASAADAMRYARDIGTDSVSSFRSRLSERTHCFLVDDGDLLVHSSWVTTAAAWTRELSTYLVPPRGDAYIYESFTRPEARGRGVYPFALQRIAAWASDEGLRRVWVAVEEHNPPSIRAVSKADFAEGFRIDFARRWGRVDVGTPYGPDASEARGFLSRNAET